MSELAGCRSRTGDLPTDFSACVRLGGSLPHSPDTVRGLLSRPMELRSFWCCSHLDSALLRQFGVDPIHWALASVPVAALVLLGVISLWFIHRRISGPQWDDDVEEALIRKMMEEFESNLTWADRVMWFCVVVGLVLLLVLLLR